MENREAEYCFKTIILKLFKSTKITLIERTIQISAAIVTLILAVPQFYQIFGISEIPLPIRISFLFISVTIISFITYSKFFLPHIPIYSSRFHFMENELPKFIRKSKSIKILNIAFTCILNLQYSKRFIKDKIIEDDAIFEILIVKRKRQSNDMSFLILREKDEKNWQLRKDMNVTLFQLFLFLLEELYPYEKDGRRMHYNLKIMEYPFCPVMCMYIFDDKDIIFGPYLSKDCQSIPMFHLKKRLYRPEISRAYNELNTHYAILNNPEMRNYKEYVDKFSYFDGTNDVSIHEFIDENFQKLSKYLDQTIKTKYEQYLTGEQNFEEFNDKWIKYLAEEELEGRFDAIMRNIAENIKNLE